MLQFASPSIVLFAAKSRFSMCVRDRTGRWLTTKTNREHERQPLNPFQSLESPSHGDVECIRW